MTPNITLILVASVLIGTGTYLFLARSLIRALMGFLLMGNGINLLFIIGSGPAGVAPIVGAGEVEAMADPVPQALILTAIVITLSLTAFVLALAHRSWQLGRQDLVDDDTESARIHDRAATDDLKTPSAREQAEEIQAETERAERETIETDRAERERSESIESQARGGRDPRASQDAEAELRGSAQVVSHEPDVHDDLALDADLHERPEGQRPDADPTDAGEGGTER